MSPKLIIAAIAVAVLGILVYSSAFMVRQTEQVIVLQFGNPVRVIQEPGLKFKIPVIQNVESYDNRVLDFAPPAEEVIAADQKRLVVDSFMRYRIADPLAFYQTVGTELGVRARLSGVISASLRRVVGNETLDSVLSDQRTEIMERITQAANDAASAFGVNVIDVRIRRADLPQANAEAIYSRMQSEREREAREFRAQGAELAQRIRARAERERTVLLAESERTSQVLRGQGDATAIRVYAEAFGRDPEFYSFFRSMEAYRKALGKDTGTTLVLSPNSDFFTYFNSIGSSLTNRPAFDAPVDAPAAAAPAPDAPAVPDAPATPTAPAAPAAPAPQ